MSYGTWSGARVILRFVETRINEFNTKFCTFFTGSQLQLKLIVLGHSVYLNASTQYNNYTCTQHDCLTYKRIHPRGNVLLLLYDVSLYVYCIVIETRADTQLSKNCPV